MTKKVSILTCLLLIFAVSPFSVMAQEAASLEAVPAAAGILAGDKSSDPFGFTVTGDGKLLTKPGPLFTEGGDYTGLELPYLLSDPNPIPYPRWAMRQGWHGRFSLAIEILPDGSVGRTKVMQSTGHRLLDRVAESAVRNWKFHPATKNGQPVVTCIQIPIVFQLEKE